MQKEHFHGGNNPLIRGCQRTFITSQYNYDSQKCTVANIFWLKYMLIEIGMNNKT